MKYRLLIGVGLVIFAGLALSSVLLYGQIPQTIPAPIASPGVVVVNTPTPVIFTIDLSQTPSAIPTGVTLLRLYSASAVGIVATMRDDGKGGDAVAGDKIFTAVLNMNQAQAALFRFQVSIALPGQLKRVVSPVLQVAAVALSTVPVVLPPDPGPAGNATIAGIDSDHDGVRDDIQRYIVFTYPASEKTRAALTQITKALQSELSDASNRSAVVTDVTAEAHAKECLDAIIMTSDSDVSGVMTSNNMYDDLKTQALNTPARAQAFFLADSQLGAFLYSGRPTFPNLSTSCTFTPSALLN